MIIKILNRNEIDEELWDNCIEKSQNGLVYAYSWYLDITTKKKWSALVYGNYEYIMPISINKKYFIKYIYQPFFTQQLGVFSKKEINEDIVNEFLKEISLKYRFININLNYANKTNGFNLTERINFELNLNKSYKELYLQFSKNTKATLKKAKKYNLTIINSVVTTEEIIKLKREKEAINLSEQNLDLLLDLLNKCVDKDIYKMYSVKNENGALISAFFFVFSHKRAYYIFAESTLEGRKKNVAFLLMNQFIKDHAEQNLILDFEGSMISGVARFFKGWGAKNNSYYNFQLNNLPLFFKFFKK